MYKHLCDLVEVLSNFHKGWSLVGFWIPAENHNLVDLLRTKCGSGKTVTLSQLKLHLESEE